jgi:hypothetical protein
MLLIESAKQIKCISLFFDKLKNICRQSERTKDELVVDMQIKVFEDPPLQGVPFWEE